MRRFTNKIVVIMRTFRSAIAMSALPPIADIGTQSRNVCFVPKADITRRRSRARDDYYHRSVYSTGAMPFRASRCPMKRASFAATV
jgi:hypothetical protein